MRLLILFVLSANACTAPPLWPPVQPWATVGDIRLADGRHLRLGAPLLLPADSTYYQSIWYDGPRESHRDSVRVLVYIPADSAFVARTEARLEGDTLVGEIGFRFGRGITLDLILQRFGPLLGPPDRIGRDADHHEFQYVEWQRRGFRFTVSAPSVTRGRPFTGYLAPSPSRGRAAGPDVESRARGCMEVSYLFCPVRRGAFF